MNRRELIASLAGAGGLLATSSLVNADTPQQRKTKADANFRQGFVDTEYGQIYYWTAGSGPNVVCIHQSSNSSQEYVSLIPLLADRCRLISLDLPGEGNSDNPTTEPTVDDYTTAVIRVLDHLDVQKTHVVAHHGGALTAMNLAARQPVRVMKSILSGTSGLKSEEETQKFIAQFSNADLSIKPENAFMGDAWGNYMDMRSDGASPEAMLKPFVAYLQSRLRPYRGLMVNLKWDRRPSMAKLKGPVLLIQGTKDKYVSHQESLTKIIPNSTHQKMPGCGTFMFYDKPKECAKVMADYFEI